MEISKQLIMKNIYYVINKNLEEIFILYVDTLFTVQIILKKEMKFISILHLIIIFLISYH